jgi:hypothetical protein
MVLALLSIALGLAGVAWASSELTGGVADIPGHWWSSLTLLPFFLAVIPAVLAARRAKTRRA